MAKLTPQDQQVLAHLRTGKHITPLEALGVFGVFRLGARIWGIKNYLAEIDSGESISVTRASGSQGKHYARYKLVKVENRDDAPIETADFQAEPLRSGTVAGRIACAA